jgi:hypothetical protein
MAISAVADDAYEGRLDRTDRLSAERARYRTRMLELTDHQRYEADWPSAGEVSREQHPPARRRWHLARR